MVSINYSAREVCCKIVFYGPGLSGKTTNLQYIHSKVPGETRGKLISLATEADRTLYFDFLPINIGTINGFQAKFQLYTVPGQVYYNATRKLVLRGVDGIVFVADSQADKMDENIESLANLEDNLREYGYDPDTLPMVIQFNKRDLPGVLPLEDLNARLNLANRPFFEASATMGNGVFDTLKMVIRLVLEKAKSTNAASGVVVSQAADKAPVAATAPGALESKDANSTGPVAVQTSPVAAQPVTAEGTTAQASTAPAADAASRPFPGSDTGALKRTDPPVGFGSQPVAGVDNEQQGGETSQPSQTIDNTNNAMVSPQMAPSLRHRGSKKRGFFKRLFGIK